MKALIASAILSLSAFSFTATAQELTDEQAEYQAWATEFLETLDPQTGDIALPEGNIHIQVPEGFYYLGSDDAYRVLVEAWGNLEGLTTDGMIFPEEYSPLDYDSWAVTLEFEDTGYISDDDALEIDYTELLQTMKSSTREVNRQREAAGLQTAELVGWAAPPRYDGETHRLYWAKEIDFSDSDENTLNYDMRFLGRRGVLSMNFVAGISKLAEVEAAAPDILAMPSFDEGSRYENFNPKLDTKSSLGLAGLVAGGAGAAVIAKKGGLILLLAFLKKGWILIVVAFGAVGRFFMGLAGKNKDDAGS